MQQHQRGGRRRAGGADRLEDVLVRVGDIGVDAGRELRNPGLEHAISEVVQRQGHLGRGEVDADVLLRSNRQRGELLLHLLHLQRSTVGDQRAIRQADAQRVADLGAFDGERIVVLTIHVAGDDQIVLQDLQRLVGDHVDGQQTLCHD